MRPLKLTLQGFRSHEAPIEISFENRNLIAIVGPTGAGKSSILDGICYALYAKTPREQRSIKKLICSRSEEARIQLNFSVDGHVYEVTRIMRRKSGTSPHVLIDVDSGEHLGSGESSVTALIEELLGLDFPAFCSSVLLAQGDFAKFLGATPTKRGEILKGVFRFEQIDALRDAAKRHIDVIGGDLREIEGERRSIPQDIADRIAEARHLFERASTRAARLEAALPAEKKLEDALRDAHASHERVTKDVARLESTSKRFPAPKVLDELRVQEVSVSALLDDCQAALVAAETRRSQAVNALGTLEVRHGAERALVELRGQAEESIRLAAEVDAFEQRLKKDEETFGGLREAADVAQHAHEEALSSCERAERQRAELEVAHKAHALRAELRVGAPCPVCEQEVAVLPTGGTPTTLIGAKTAEKEAKEAAQRAGRVAEDARTALTRAESGLAHLAEQRDSTKERLDRMRVDLADALGDTDDPLAEVDVRLEGLAAARLEVERARSVCEEAQAEIGRHQALEAEFSAARRAVAAALIEVAATVELDAPGIDDPLESLVVRSEGVRVELDDRLDKAHADLAAAELAEQSKGEELAELRAGLELEPTSPIAPAMARARSEADVAAERIGELEAKAARAAELDEREAGLVGRRSNFQQLYKDFGPKGFISFLLEEKTRVLFELASETLRSMTNRYQLEVDRKADLNVVDELDGEKRRTVDTLSGGETFLASLALALALAELVTRSGGRLQCFFLDEGFGSLDPESFDLAMDGIERIVTTDRLIGLVSHVPALAARVEDRIELAKRPDGMSELSAGSRVV
ncbi:MAG: SMC family ATPase [Actinomycetota bacterium]|nr:SMC family ATPase [Actinomycetota bacterium]